jgi:ABC-type transport system involved in cytochrome c biogenesis permease subunit
MRKSELGPPSSNYRLDRPPQHRFEQRTTEDDIVTCRPDSGNRCLHVNLLIAAVCVRITGVARTFPPFAFWPILTGSLAGALLTTGVFAIVRASVIRPGRVFLFIVLVCSAVSYALPLRPSFTRSARFAGITPAAQVTLVVMHTVVATMSVVLLTRYAGRPEP